MAFLSRNIGTKVRGDKRGLEAPDGFGRGAERAEGEAPEAIYMCSLI